MVRPLIPTLSLTLHRPTLSNSLVTPHIERRLFRNVGYSKRYISKDELNGRTSRLSMAMVHPLPHPRLLVLHRRLVVSSVTLVLAPPHCCSCFTLPYVVPPLQYIYCTLSYHPFLRTLIASLSLSLLSQPGNQSILFPENTARI